MRRSADCSAVHSTGPEVSAFEVRGKTMFHAAIYANSRADGIGVLEVVEPTGTAVEKVARRFVPLQRTVVHGAIVGPLATLQLIQTFSYPRTACDQVLEARYRFPLPGDAAVTGVTVRFGDVEIVAQLAERTQAERDYAEAKAAGRQATLTTRESPDVFTLQVAGLQPDQPVTVTTHYVQLARLESGRNLAEWRLRIPLTTAPRYTRGDEQGSRAAAGQPLALLRDPGHRFALDLTLAGATQPHSLTHQLQLSSLDSHSQDEGDVTGLRIQLAAGEVVPDRDFVLAWLPLYHERQPTLSVYPYLDQAAQQLYFLALVAPPALRPSKTSHAREVILLVDHSGSMSGPKWAAADWAVERFLGDLQPGDYFALATFHNTTRWFHPQLLPAQAKNVAGAITWFKAQRDSGGTELGVALEQALQLPRPSGQLARHLLIVTDAAVSDAARILRLADQEAAVAERRRISVLCIDAAPNDFLVQELAERGGGLARFLTSDPQQEDITTALDEVLLAWAEPVLVNLQLTLNRSTVVVSGRQPTHADRDQRSFIDLGDLPAGQAQWVVGRVPWGADDQANPLIVDLVAGREAHLASSQVTLAGATAPSALKALFGARRVNGLEHLINANYDWGQLADQLARLGYDPALVLGDKAAATASLYAENQRQATQEKLRKLLVQEALQYGLASAETAFLATRTEAGELVAGTVAVANALPAGWSEAFAQHGPFLAPSMAAPAAMPIAAFAQSTANPGIVQRGAMQALGTTARSLFGGRAAREATPSAAATEVVIFSGTLGFARSQVQLFDSSLHPERLPDAMTLTALRLQTADPQSPIDSQVMLLIYVDDLAMPRARVCLRDLWRHGERPLNLQRAAGQALRIVLEGGAPVDDDALKFTLSLRYQAM